MLRHNYINLTCLPKHESIGTRSYLLVVQYHTSRVTVSLLRRGLLQLHRGWEEGKTKARRERSRFLSPGLLFFFHWCLLTGASVEERVLRMMLGCYDITMLRI